MVEPLLVVTSTTKTLPIKISRTPRILMPILHTRKRVRAITPIEPPTKMPRFPPMYLRSCAAIRIIATAITVITQEDDQ